MRAFLITACVLLVLCGMLYVSLYSGLNTGREAALSSLGDVDAALQRRSDLIPNLVETVKAYARHEEKVFTAVTEARAKVGQINVKLAAGDEKKMRELAMAEAEYKSSLTKLLAVAEAYPDLKASKNFLSLQDQLEGTENRVTVARQAYNREARHYNTYVHGLFAQRVAANHGFEKLEYFEAVGDARKPVKVKFD